MKFSTDKSLLKFGHAYEFILKDGSNIKGQAFDGCVVVGSLFGSDRQDVCWTKVNGFYITEGV